jgi:hypothetical protein
LLPVFKFRGFCKTHLHFLAKPENGGEFCKKIRKIAPHRFSEAKIVKSFVNLTGLRRAVALIPVRTSDPYRFFGAKSM